MVASEKCCFVVSDEVETPAGRDMSLLVGSAMMSSDAGSSAKVEIMLVQSVGKRSRLVLFLLVSSRAITDVEAVSIIFDRLACEQATQVKADPFIHIAGQRRVSAM